MNVGKYLRGEDRHVGTARITPAPTLFRFRYQLAGGHVHVRFFAGKGTLSLGLAGTFCLRAEEWEDFKTLFPAPGNVEFALEPSPVSSSNDVLVWPDKTFCLRAELPEYARQKGDDYIVLRADSPEWIEFFNGQ